MPAYRNREETLNTQRWAMAMLAQEPGLTG